MKTPILSLLIVLLAGCQLIHRMDVFKEAGLTSSPIRSISLISRITGGIYILDTVHRSITQIQEVKNGGEIKYSFKKRPETSKYDFIFAAENGSAPRKIQTFVFDRSSLTSSTSTIVDFGDGGQFNGPEYFPLQNKVVFVKVGADRTALHSLDLPGLRTSTNIVDEPLRVTGDICCDSLSNGVIFASFSCNSGNLIHCFANDNTTQAIYFANIGTSPVKLTFPELDQRLNQSPHRPLAHHLGDVDPRMLETDLGNSLVFQRLFTTPDLFASNAPAELRGYLTQGFHGSYYKLITNLNSPGNREFRLNYDSWVLNNYPLNQRSTVTIRSIMSTPDIKIATDEPDKLDIVISANIQSPDLVNGKPFDFDGLLRGRFARIPDGSSGNTIDVERITPILETREFACALWDKTDILDEDGNINVYTHPFTRFMDDNLIVFSSSKVPIITKDRIDEINGLRYIKNLGNNSQPMPVEQWRSLFCGHPS